MSASLDALEALAANNVTAWFNLSALSQAVLFYATNYLTVRKNWIDANTPLDEITDSEWDTLDKYVSNLLYEAKKPMIGAIIPFVTQDPLPNVLPCDGSTYLRVDYPNLYDVIDTFFIVDADHFNVPDLRGRTVIGVGNGGGLSNRNIGDSGGEETHQLTTSEIPSHGHSDIGHTHSIPLVVGLPAQAGVGFSANQTVPILTANTGLGFANITNTGGDGTHENMQPFYALNYGIIAS
jgi:microcystin-dependent protein